ncbi:PEGA domain-containing protein [Shewanella sp. VB17]|uniref:PEGA domain-containing protein n=1 Tax=Shewanella sp. VB17 TaxID=2739432 RepID=UPI001564274F|nr:PEGA domain-containing protein [Shewanella sp. VB17]NRD73831.1 PEGA domain-containing protein [Shewanella sp. VB17]
MKKTLMISTLLATTFISGCSSMFNGTTQTVNIRTNEEGAKLYVNEQYMGQDSATYTFKKKDNYVLRVEKEGCQSNSLKPEKAFDPTTLLGIFIDYGIVSILLIDGAATGAWQEFEQTNYVLDPICDK